METKKNDFAEFVISIPQNKLDYLLIIKIARMYKQHLFNNIEKEINICRRLYTKISPTQLDFRPKEGVRSILELLQYLGIIGSSMLSYWLKIDGTDFDTFFETKKIAAKAMRHEQFLTVMGEQIVLIKDLFNQMSEEDLFHKEVTYPWGGKAALGEGIIATSIKWLSAYKLQLFLFIKLAGDQKLTTADAWLLTELQS